MRWEGGIHEKKISLLHRRSSGAHATHSVQAGGQLRILLLDLQLGTGGLGVGDGINDFGFGASKLGCSLEILEGLRDLALLQEQLGHGADRDVALRID